MKSPIRKIRRHPIDFFVSLIFAGGALVLFLALLVISVSWRNPQATPVAVEIVSDLPPEKIEPPTPAPPPPKVIEPPPAPPPPPPAIKPPEPDPDIALKKKEEARKKAEEAERLKKEKEEKAAKEKKEKAEREQKEKERKEAQEKKEREEKARRDREERERRAAADRAAREAQALADAQRKKLVDNWMEKIQNKIRGNINLPPQITGNPQVIFEVNLLPTCEVLNVRLVQASGNSAYDDAVYRAILKSSPLPKPEQNDIFDRNLRLRFRPNE